MTGGPDVGALEDLAGQPHRRYDPLADEWVLVSAGRSQRPWSGRREHPAPEVRAAFDPDCYLCPGALRASGERNPLYTSTFVFTNDFAALTPDSTTARLHDGLLVAAGEQGTCRVICFSPRHDLSLSMMSADAARTVVDTWADESTALGRRFPFVQVFENRGAAMGASNPHPHGQIWAASTVPTRLAREERAQTRHHMRTGLPLLLEYAEQEIRGPRRVQSDDEWLVVVPFWAAWPYETLVIPRRPVARLPELDQPQRAALTTRLISMLQAYDTLFDNPFPYSLGWHQAPFDGQPHLEWQLHAHVYPPLLRADVRKFMVGYELLSEVQRDITPEDAAEQLLAASRWVTDRSAPGTVHG